MQRVNADEEDVVVAINQFHGLLHLAVHLGTHQAAKLSHAVVDVYDKIAGGELVQLLERQGHLSAACAVALEIIFVEATE